MTPNEKWLLEEKYSGKETEEYEENRRRLAKGEPLAYVIGWQPFLGLKIYLDSRPLIPRPETEWWVEEMFRATSEWSGRPKGGDPRTFARGAEHLQFLDLCAGSGAIGCAALANLPNARVYFGELNPAHEATILKNIRVNNLDESRAHVRVGDLLEPFGDMKFDVIVANPPYVPTGRTLPASVTNYEPSLALMAGADGLDVIRRIAAELPRHLIADGTAWIECDSAHAKAAQKLFEAQGLDVKIHNDQYNRPRFFVIKSHHV